jgi:hypothetical protein
LFLFFRCFIAAACFYIRKPIVVLRLQAVILHLACAFFPLAACGGVVTCEVKIADITQQPAYEQKNSLPQ